MRNKIARDLANDKYRQRIKPGINQDKRDWDKTKILKELEEEDHDETINGIVSGRTRMED